MREEESTKLIAEVGVCEGVAWSVKRVPVPVVVPPKHHPDVCCMVILYWLKLEVILPRLLPGLLSEFGLVTIVKSGKNFESWPLEEKRIVFLASLQKFVNY